MPKKPHVYPTKTDYPGAWITNDLDTRRSELFLMSADNVTMQERHS